MTRTLTIALLLGAWLATPAQAHDTWFERLPDNGLALGTGNQFPRQESGLDPRFIATSGCRAARLATTLAVTQVSEHALGLRASPGASTCWLQSAPFALTLEPDKIEPYLREANPGPALRAAWADLHRRGLPWRERYVKHARIELADAPSATPAPLGLDLAIEHDGPIEAGQTFAVRVRRDGAPLAGQAVELRSEDSPLGLWRRSDEEGRLTFPALLPGRWLLRAIELRLSASEPDTFESRFATTAFQIGMNFSSNARSANQAAASAAITSEPPSSTTRR